MLRGPVVVALGGNALAPEGKGTYAELKQNIKRSISFVPELLRKGIRTVIVSGSGPQVGALLLESELAKEKLPAMPLDVLDAQLEGWLGYLIQQEIRNELLSKNIDAAVVTIITQVLVDRKDIAFKNPTKPVGPFYSRQKAMRLKRKGISVVFQQGRGWRRVVPSPKPLNIIELKTVKHLLKENIALIAAGGGGIPVYKSRGKLKGVEAVIDKDFAAACLGKGIKAKTFIVLTGEENVFLNYRKKNQKAVRRMSILEAKKYLRQGQFPAGSMGPKIEAAIDFLKTGERVIITSPDSLPKALDGKAGSVISR
ncbi:MAG: carbamate kinase [Candidatus Diapherotrites archaeon]|uniref:Carbamate kinase n=1 Tax=Candidatus Iainarchaeum sp. TaxID=3101447 RepID=A0A7J4IVX2_9ARCH|nr:MAG: carbamate kinase [archaeon GW2011_AR10]MBS3059185.1 carbamate kinase [Candidatus Diapherotrites archaeon]HIH07867.1 carbamate kinase [Candidatus Diapherotrites archaeon]